MKEHKCQKWEEYEEWVSSLFDERARLRQKSSLKVSKFLFRGQSDASWHLETALERYGTASLDAFDYYKAIFAAKPQIESFTGQTWSLPTPPQYEEWLEKQTSLGLFEIPGYEYLVHLRHHGFPSPLLDWTQSPYIAAFFAFNSANTSAERIAIYGYMEYAGSAKGGSNQEPTIKVRGPFVTSHKRHFLQQSQYTICTKYINNRWRYASHEEAFSRNNDEQDLLWKVTLPASERLRALQYLDRFNLNSFTLFGSEESLMETVAARTFNFAREDL